MDLVNSFDKIASSIPVPRNGCPANSIVRLTTLARRALPLYLGQHITRTDSWPSAARITSAQPGLLVETMLLIIDQCIPSTCTCLIADYLVTPSTQSTRRINRRLHHRQSPCHFPDTLKGHMRVRRAVSQCDHVRTRRYHVANQSQRKRMRPGPILRHGSD